MDASKVKKEASAEKVAAQAKVMSHSVCSEMFSGHHTLCLRWMSTPFLIFEDLKSGRVAGPVVGGIMP